MSRPQVSSTEHAVLTDKDGQVVDVETWAHRTKVALPVAKLVAWIIVPASLVFFPLVRSTFSAIDSRIEEIDKSQKEAENKAQEQRVRDAARQVDVDARIKANSLGVERVETVVRTMGAEIKAEIRALKND